MKTKIKTFQDLMMWKKMHQLVLKIYKATKLFPADERFGLVIQLRRSASSVATNIAEGFKKRSKKDQLHFLNIADCSLEETKYHLILSRDLNYLTTRQFKELMDSSEEIGRMLNGYYRTVQEKMKSVAINFSSFLLTSYFLLLTSQIEGATHT